MEKNKPSIYNRLPKSLTTVTTFSKILALLLFFLFPLVGFLLGTKYQAKLDFITFQTITGKSIINRYMDSTSNWKIYKNTKYGYSLMLPSEWKIRSGNKTDDIYNAQDIFLEAAPLDFEVSIIVSNNQDNKPLEYFLVPTNSKGGIYVTYTDSIIDGEKAKRTSDEPGMVPNETVKVKHGKLVYEISFLNLSGKTFNEEQIQIFDRILSTFKFTNQLITPSSAQKISCNSDADCNSGETCQVWGPIVANEAPHKFCTAPGQSAPL